MDYCHVCRRHLNGALACPGCGTPAEHPRATGRPHVSYGTPYDDGCDGHGTRPGPAGSDFSGGHPEEAAGGHPDTPADGHPGEADHGHPGEAGDAHADEGDDGIEDDSEEGEAAPEGRAARRRGRTEGDRAARAGGSRRDRKAAAHRRRRRRALLITAGFVLAAGGLSLAELGSESPFSTPAPTAADTDSPEGGPPSDAGESSAEPLDARSSGTPGGGSTTAGGRPSRSASAPARASASASPTPGDTPDPAPSATSSAEPPAESSDPAPADPTATQSDPPSPPDPAPTPSPTETCDRFLWWCT